MIATLTGVLSHRDPSGIILDVGGVGYFIEVPLGVYERLPAAGTTVVLHTELVVREDAWSLFGFDTATDRAIFRRLLGASGVGARLALAILSTLGSDRAVGAIRNRDLATLSTVPGIGRKKAERIALELGDRLDDLAGAGGTGAVSSPSADAVLALVGLGFQAAAAEQAVRRISDDGERDTGALIRRALSDLTRT